MPRPKRYHARVNLVMPKETFDAYQAFAEAADTTVQQLMRDFLAESLPTVRRMTEAILEVRRHPDMQNQGAAVLLRHFQALQADMSSVIAETEAAVHEAEERTKRKPA